MEYSEIKAVKLFCDGLLSSPDWREVVQSVLDGEDDFTVDNVRFIADSVIDEIQTEELGDDEYALGCFNSRFLSGILDIDRDAIKAMQKAEAFEAIGKLIKSLGRLGDIQAAYSKDDGYGHYFNSYDSGEEEITINGTLYHVFDNH